jgi:hypothetical protein
MVVAGDPGSMWNQSYLQVLATPSLDVTNSLVWAVNLSVLSLVNMTYFHPAGCPAYALNLSWNNTYYCEFDDLPGGNALTLFTGLAAGQNLGVTFDGTVGGTGGMRVYVNGTGGVGSVSETLNVSTTGSHPFEPAYSAACASACFLQWGQSYGLGVGVDICPFFGTTFATCDSYNGTAYPSLPPVTWGIPEFWNVSAYSGDYHYLQPESASGVCDSNPPGGQFVAGCQEFTSGGGDGFYPHFSLAGTGLDFGSAYPGSVTSFGGPYQQFLDVSGTQDLLPFVETGLSDSSLAGFLAPNRPLNVSVNVTDLGTIGRVTLAWSLSGSTWTTVDLAGVGSASAATYAGVVPSGPNGPIRYQVNATNSVGVPISSPVRTVVRGPLPSFTLGIGIDPGTCGTVRVGGTAYPNASSVVLGPGPVAISASGCFAYNFTSWETTGGLTASPAGNPTAELTVGASGNVTALFAYVRPTEHLSVVVTPVGCGAVVIDGTSYTNGSVAGVLFGLPQNLSFSTLCAGYAFGGWTPGANVTVLGSSLVADDNGTLTATFVPTATTDAVSFGTRPATCGGVGFGGAGYTTGESIYIAPGTYPLTPEPCLHYGFENFTAAPAVPGSPSPGPP